MSGGFVTLWLDVFVIYDYGYGFNIGALGDGVGSATQIIIAYVLRLSKKLRSDCKGFTSEMQELSIRVRYFVYFLFSCKILCSHSAQFTQFVL